MFYCVSLILFGNRNKWREVHEIKPCALLQLRFTGFVQFFFCSNLRFSAMFFCGSSVLKALATGLHVGRQRWLGSPWARIRGADPEFWSRSVGWIFKKCFQTSVLLNHTFIFPCRSVCCVLLLFFIGTPWIIYKCVRMQRWRPLIETPTYFFCTKKNKRFFHTLKRKSKGKIENLYFQNPFTQRNCHNHGHFLYFSEYHVSHKPFSWMSA